MLDWTSVGQLDRTARNFDLVRLKKGIHDVGHARTSVVLLKDVPCAAGAQLNGAQHAPLRDHVEVHGVDDSSGHGGGRIRDMTSTAQSMFTTTLGGRQIASHPSGKALCCDATLRQELAKLTP